MCNQNSFVFADQKKRVVNQIRVMEKIVGFWLDRELKINGSNQLYYL